MKELIIGSHVSFKNDTQLLGSVKEALSYNANTFMFYTGAPQNTNRGQINDALTLEAYKLMRENSNNFDFSVSLLIYETERCSLLGIKYLVLHPGSAVNVTRDIAISNIIRGLKLILDTNYDVMILLETMAGKGNEIGRDFEELATIINGVSSSKLGVCLDTCHISDAGYDISNFDEVLLEFDKKIGLDKLKCLHINDSKNERGSHKDRHENIGFGYLGFNNLLKIIYHEKLQNIPKILETPYITYDDNSKERIYPPYKEEIAMIRNKEFDKDMILNIRKANQT